MRFLLQFVFLVAVSSASDSTTTEESTDAATSADPSAAEDDDEDNEEEENKSINSEAVAQVSTEVSQEEPIVDPFAKNMKVVNELVR